MKTGNGLIPENIVRLLNYRINQEELSSRLYYAMHEWLDYNGYFGAAKLWKEYSEEELEHAGWARKILEDYNYLPETQALGNVQEQFKGLPDIINASLEHELTIAKQCLELASESSKACAWQVFTVALKFVDEQTDEIAKINNWVDRLEMMGDDKREIMLLDQEMGKEAGGCLTCAV